MIRKRIKRYTVGYANSVSNWTGAFAGLPVFIIGNGPSLNDHDLSPLENRYFSIGINRAFYKIDTTILLWQDLSLWHTDKHRILKTNSMKYCKDRADIQGRFYHFKLMAGDYKLPESASTLWGRGSSGPLAFQLAYILGCDPIVLLGMCCRYKNNKTSFFGTNPCHRPNSMRQCRNGLNFIKNCRSGRTVYNCSDNKVFDQHYELPDVLKRLENVEPLDRETLTQRLLHHNK